ncbi:MAG: hypothetical protein IPK16_28625 [Anaerolineales bacterium]|nr:hypothetical protein [Anaerolineales bacterium]
MLFLSYTPILTPTAPTAHPPGQLKFGHFEFDLRLFLNDVEQINYPFAAPLTLTIAYSQALLSNLKEETLVLDAWDGTDWNRDGIQIITHDLVHHVLVVTIAHPAKFAFFAELPTDIDPEPEPDATDHLYLPGLYSEAGTRDRAPAEAAEPAAAPSPFVALEQIFLPAMKR